MVERRSPWEVDETVARLVGVLEARGVKVFAVIDHSGEARAAGLELRETKVVVFGNPAAGTPVMAAVPLVALDLPLKVLVWASDDGTRVDYLAPDELAARYDLPAELAARLAAIDGLVDAALSAQAS